MLDLIIRGGNCVTDEKMGEADIAVNAGKIAAIGDLSQAHADKIISARGLHVLPGVIDTQVHFREPGLIYKEDLATGSLAAVMGGVTAVFEMPNTNPPTVDGKRLKDKLAAARGRMLALVNRPDAQRPPEGMVHIGSWNGVWGFKVFDGTGKEIQHVKEVGDDSEHMENFLDCLRTRKLPNADIGVGHISGLHCHLANIVSRTGRTVHFDAETETIVDDRQANLYVSRRYRTHWATPAGA